MLPRHERVDRVRCLARMRGPSCSEVSTHRVAVEDRAVVTMA